MLEPAAETYLDILEEHIDELEALWLRRELAVRSPDYTPRTLQALDERIEAHTDGLVLGADEAERLLADALGAAEEPSRATGIAFALLRMETAATRQAVLGALAAAPPPIKEGIGVALCFAPAAALLAPLTELQRTNDPLVAAVALEALSIHGGAPDPNRAADLLGHEDPAVRRAAWRTLAWRGDPRWVAEDVLRRGLRDADASVRAAVRLTAALTRQRVLPDELRAARDDLRALELLAALGDVRDLPLLRESLVGPTLGPRRFGLAVASGHPTLIAALVDVIEGKQPADAVAAGLAFAAITNLDITSEEVVTLPVDWLDGPAADPEPTDEVRLPDAQQARQLWNERRSAYDKGSRWHRGVEVPRAPLAAADLQALDMRLHWLTFLAAAHAGADTGAFLPFWRKLQPL